VAVNEENISLAEQPEVNEQDAFIAQAPEKPARQELSPVITIARTTVNYIVIAVVFLLVGIFIGAFSAFRVERTYRSWVSEAIASAMAEQDFGALIDASRPPSMDNPDSRFEVSATADHVLGSAEAPIVMVEFGDFNCGFCRRFHDETFPQLMETYGDQLRFIYRDYPILAESSVTAAVAARCAGEQDKFWEYHNALYENQGMFNQTGGFAALAEQVGLDVESFNTCVEEQRYLSGVVADYQEGQSFGIRGTPAFFINGRPVSGAQPYEVFAGVIEEELAVVNGETNMNTPNNATSES
jgi:protein-disulfide isomerase